MMSKPEPLLRRLGSLIALSSASLAVIVAFSLSAQAQETDQPIRDVAELREHADSGDADAQYDLAMRYRDGDGIEQDYVEALRLLRLAANQDGTEGGSVRAVALARSAIGNLYFSGQGVSADYAESVKWFQRAIDIAGEDAEDVVIVATLNLEQATRFFARQGDRDAQATLGTWYANGEGVPQDYAAALTWLEPAAKQGSPLAQGELARLYLFGLGVEADANRALLLLLLAAEAGNVASGYNLGVMSEHLLQDAVLAHALYNVSAARGYAHGEADARARRNAVEQQMSVDEIAGAQALAARLNRPSALRTAVWERLSPLRQRTLIRLEEALQEPARE